MREILDKLNEIEAEADKFHDESDTHNMAYCMGQMNILNWMWKNAKSDGRHILVYFGSVHLIHAGFKEEEDGQSRRI